MIIEGALVAIGAAALSAWELLAIRKDHVREVKYEESVKRYYREYVPANTSTTRFCPECGTIKEDWSHDNCCENVECGLGLDVPEVIVFSNSARMYEETNR